MENYYYYHNEKKKLELNENYLFISILGNSKRLNLFGAAIVNFVMEPNSTQLKEKLNVTEDFY